MRISDWSSDVCSSDLSRPPYRDAGTVARSAYARAPIEPCPTGSRPTWFGSMRQGVDNLAFGNDAGVAGVTPLRDFRPQRCKVGQLAIDFRDVYRSYLVGPGPGTPRIIRKPQGRKHDRTARRDKR